MSKYRKNIKSVFTQEYRVAVQKHLLTTEATLGREKKAGCRNRKQR